ncbi:MAG: HU family DNA-binding protein [Candidatus Sumerlaeaceae bacterium]
MIKVEIVKRVAEHLKMKDKEALVIVDSIIEAMKKIVAEEGRLEIRDFGVFQTKKRKERIGRNPKDKKEYPIPARRVVTFKMGRELKVSGEQNPSVTSAGGGGNSDGSGNRTESGGTTNAMGQTEQQPASAPNL